MEWPADRARCQTPQLAALGLLSFALGAFLTVWTGPRSAAVPVGPGAPLLELAALEFAAGAAAGLGAQFAPTVPLLGVVEPYDGPSKIQAKDPLDPCPSSVPDLSAAVQVHGEFFKGPGGQQDAQRQFLVAVHTTLCADPGQSEEQYQERLHGMLAKVRTAINRHVQSAFLVKSACAHTAREDTSGRTESEACVGTVLSHEGYNLVEGYYVVELTLGLLVRSAAFCTDPSRDELLRAWSDELEQMMAFHRGNSAFEVLADNVRAQLCPATIEDGAAKDTFVEDVATNAQAFRDQVAMPDSEKVCVFPKPEWLPFVHSNPPDVSDGITIFEQNTQVSLGLTAAAARRVLASEGCIGESGELRPEDASRLVAQIDASGLLLPPYARSGGRVRWSKEEPEWEGDATMPADKDGQDTLRMLSLPTVYHKLVSACVINQPRMCDVDNSGGMPFMCEGVVQPINSTHLHGSIGEDNPVFDITTSTDIAKCSGEACVAAAKAVLAYQRMLGPLTKMRWDLIQVVFGFVPAMPILKSTSWVRQRSCAAFTNIVNNAAEVQAQLPAVLDGMRASTDQLTLACIAPDRTPSHAAPPPER